MNEMVHAARTALDVLPRDGRISIEYEDQAVCLHVHQDARGWFWAVRDKARPLSVASGLSLTLDQAVRLACAAAGLRLEGQMTPQVEA